MALTKVRGSGLDSSQEGAITFNEGSADVDFRVESNGQTHALFVDAGSDHVNINTSTDLGSTLNVNGDITCANANAGVLLVENAADANASNFTFRKSRNTTLNAHTVVQSDDSLGNINFQGSDGDEFLSGASITAAVDTTPGNNDMPGRLMFSTTADGASSPTERMRIDPNGNIAIGNDNPADDTPGIGIQFDVSSSNTSFMNIGHTTGAGTSDGFIRFHRSGSTIGQIRTDGVSNVQYVTSSDYRLKENIVTDWDATSRLKQLKPSRFNFKEEKDITRDGFIAHEVSSIVPEAVGGEKDAMTKEVLYVEGDKIPEGKKVGDVKKPSQIDPQGIDQSKLVPLLTKALQEAVAKIETLEAKVTALESK